MKRLLAFSFGLLLSVIASALELPAYTELTGSKVLFYFDSDPIDILVKSVKVCTNRSPLKSLDISSPDHDTISATIGKHEFPCTEVTGLNFISPGHWTLTATLENNEKARLVILVRAPVPVQGDAVPTL